MTTDDVAELGVNCPFVLLSLCITVPSFIRQRLVTMTMSVSITQATLSLCLPNDYKQTKATVNVSSNLISSIVPFGKFHPCLITMTYIKSLIFCQRLTLSGTFGGNTLSNRGCNFRHGDVSVEISYSKRSF
ncbi:MAG TPA: hypothetical protein ENH82_03695 [bacterium]|nr:hypothetical protein [bacterium]